MRRDCGGAADRVLDRGAPRPATARPRPCTPAYAEIDARYDDAVMLPRIATPSAPPTSRVVSLTAEPTPAFSGGNEPMIESVAGAIARPMPTPRMSSTSGDQSVARRRRHVREEPHRERDEHEAARDDELRADTRDEQRAQRRGDDERERNRQQPHTRRQRVVAEHELQVLRQEEQRAEHREEHERDRGRRRREARVLEERHVEHRMVRMRLPRDERAEQHRADHERGDDDGIDQPRVGPSMMP